MKRKLATTFGKNNRQTLKPPYLTNQERSQFQMEFTLFGDTIDLKQLLSAANSRKDKLMSQFIGQLLLKDNKLGFEDYLHEIQLFINEKPTAQRNQVLFQLLDQESEGEISLSRFRSIMQEAGDNPLSEEEAASMLNTISGNNGQANRLTRQQFCTVMSHRPNQQ